MGRLMQVAGFMKLLRGNMKIKEIQEYNRKLILKSCGLEDKTTINICEECEGSGADEDQFCGTCQGCTGSGDYQASFVNPLGLSEVLRVLPNYTLINMLALEKCCKITVYCGFKKELGRDRIHNEEIIWNLTKPTLEDQEESVQISVWKLLGGEDA